MTDHQNSSAESCELQTLLEVRDFLRDISTGADVTDASRDSATEFVALLDAEYAEKWEGSDGEPSNGKQPLMASRPAPPVPSDHTFSVAQSAQETALRDIVSWKEDVLGDRSKPRGPYDCAPEVTEAFDRGARMAFYRCALRASEALASQPSPAATVKDTPKQFLMQRDPAAPVETEDDTEDMAAVGRAFMEAIEQARLSDPWVKTWAPIQCPSEIIFDLLNREVDQESQAKEPEASGGLCAVAPHEVQVGSSVVGSRTATSERMDVTAGETAPHFQCSAGSEAVDPVRRAFRNADAQDWEHLSSLLGYGGHGKFWRHVFEEVREALLHTQPQSVLWCCHARGPDDVYAAPDYATALAWSDALNEVNWSKSSKLNIPDPASWDECLVRAAPAPWPYSQEAHAENLPKSVEGFSSPLPRPQSK
jgi:hypothetical protein